MAYDHKAIDSKWQKKWDEGQAFKTEDARTTKKPKYYALDMFPYPSGHGLHVGHLASYTPTDVISRYKRAKGFNVLHPMGYDAFGLPAEQFAIQTGVHPAETTQKAITAFRSTLKTMGYSFDWSREISTADPKFYKWTQFIFEKLFEKGLAYQKDAPVNWCPELRTVLANDEVIDGKSERGGHPVIRVPMKQWMLKITDYAERLIADLDKVQWPDRTVEAQRNWIGKSEGANVTFALKDHAESLEIFTTRPDTLYGVTFMVVSPEHPVLGTVVPASHKASVADYQKQAAKKSDVERKAATEKTGVFTGAYAVNPFSGQQVPVWTADYVMMDYGTGAIMAVPGHDERDFEFAQTFKIPVERVLEPKEGASGDLPFTGDGKLVNSDFLNGLDKAAGIKAAIAEIEKRKLGTKVTQYKLRDWLFSRQRYWGEPFPLVKFPNGEIKTVPVNELPVLLPNVADYKPSEKGESPLARDLDYVNYKGAAGKDLGLPGTRETDTMPGSAGSSWYFLRYCDPLNDDNFCDFETQKYWMPVDLYVGGPEHSVGHLLYARFWQKVLFDAGLVSSEEPFQKLAHQGLILGPDGEKMSKSRGNVINPDTLRDQVGADALRTFILFLGPMSADKPWQEQGIGGVQRFLDRLWRACVDDNGAMIADDSEVPAELNRLLHKTIKKVGEDIESMGFNTAISALMILLNEVYKTNCRSRAVLLPMIQMVAPFAPHVAEELWEKLAPNVGQLGFVSNAPWPKFDSSLTVDSVVSIGVQVNGKVRGVIEIDKEAAEADALAKALELSGVQNAVGGKPIDKVIYKAGRILNLIVKN